MHLKPEKMSPAMRRRMYRAQVIHGDPLCTLVVLPSQDSHLTREVYRSRVRDPELMRHLAALRQKYRIPLDNVEFQGFKASELVKYLGADYVEKFKHEDPDQTSVEEDEPALG